MQAIGARSALAVPVSLAQGRGLVRGLHVGVAEVVAVLSLAALTTATRIAVRTTYLFNWDAVQFALGVQRFDVIAHRPHPPGYPGYVLLGRALAGVSGGSAETGLVLLSAFAESAAVVLAYVAARLLWGRFAGWSAAILLFTSPLFWFYGATALSYAIEPVLSLAVLWMAHRACRGHGGALLLAGFAAGLAGAIRPTDEAFLAVPLGWAAWRAWRSGQRSVLAGAAAVVAATSLAWLIPLMLMSGGPARFLLASRELSTRASDTSALWKTGLYGLQLNAGAVLAGLALSLGLVAPLGLSYAIVRRLPRVAAGGLKPLTGLDRDYTAVSVALLLPALVVYLLVHIGQLGYILLLLPALLLPAGMVLDGLSRAIFAGARAPQARVVLLAACALANAATFALPEGGLHDQLRQHDAYVKALVATVRAYDPATTVLLTSAEANGSYRLAQFYLRSYPVIAVGKDRQEQAGEMFSTAGGAPEYDLARFERAGRFSLPRTTRTVVVLDGDAAALVGDRGLLTPVRFGDKWPAWITRLTGTTSAAAFGGWVYIRAIDCPCHGAGRTAPVPVPQRPL